MSPIRVLLVDDHAILRESLRAFLEAYPDLKVVGEASDGIAAIAEAYRCRPDVVVLDIVMPGLRGPEVTRRLKEELPAIRVLILTQYSDADYVLPCIQAGAEGYVLKRAGGAELVRAVRSVYEGDGYLHPSIARLVMEAAANNQTGLEDPLAALTGRERDVLVLIGHGMTNREIAGALAVSTKTVDKHRSRVMNKLGLGSRAALIRYAVEKHLVSTD